MHYTAYSIDLGELVKSRRLLFINIKRPSFCGQNVSLATLLMTNPSAINKISAFVRDMPAYIVPAYCGPQELDIAYVSDNLPSIPSFVLRTRLEMGGFCTQLQLHRQPNRLFLT
jgi:hypothetical protein